MMNKKTELEHYDYLIVGSGLWGATFAYLAKEKGKKCLVIEKRDTIGGNMYCENEEGINVHKYGPHIFHTDNKRVWDFVNQFCDFNNFILSPIAKYADKIYHLPFNMNTFYELFGVLTPEEAKKRIENECQLYKKLYPNADKKNNLRDKACLTVGMRAFTGIIDCYTEKQWGRNCADLPPDIISRLPVRYTFNNNYFNDRYQGIPIGGYSSLINSGLLAGIEVLTNTNFFEEREYWEGIADKIVYTGSIDEFFDYSLGVLEYRSLRWEKKVFDESNVQGTAVINYTDHIIPYTRSIEHKHFECLTEDKVNKNKKSVVTYEYPQEWTLGLERFYPINDKKNQDLYKKYQEKASKLKNVIFGGRLAEYKYYDMDDTIESVFKIEHTI